MTGEEHAARTAQVFRGLVAELARRIGYEMFPTEITNALPIRSLTDIADVVAERAERSAHVTLEMAARLRLHARDVRKGSS